MSTYLVIPFVPVIKHGQGSPQVAKQLGDLIDLHVNEGWDYYRLEQVTTYVKPGCIGALFGHSMVPVTHQFIIFRSA